MGLKFVYSCRKNGFRNYYNHLNLRVNKRKKKLEMMYGINNGQDSEMPSLSKTYMYTDCGKVYFCAPSVKNSNTKVVDIWNLSNINSNNEMDLYDNFPVEQTLDMYNELAVDINGSMNPNLNYDRKLLILTNSMLHIYI